MVTRASGKLPKPVAVPRATGALADEGYGLREEGVDGLFGFHFDGLLDAPAPVGNILRARGLAGKLGERGPDLWIGQSGQQVAGVTHLGEEADFGGHGSRQRVICPDLAWQSECTENHGCT